MEQTDKTCGLGALVVFSGPSGAGKSTVCQLLFPRLKRLKFSVSCTTRSPREGEIDGVHYHFLTVDAFRRKIDAGEFLEWAEVHGNYYGTLISEVEPHIMAGDDVILDIDVQGEAQIKEAVAHRPELRAALTTIFLTPPSLTVLEQRLRGRGTDAESAIVKRLGNARGEMARWRDYDYIVVNDEATLAADKVEALIVAAHCRTAAMPKEPWND